LRATTVSQNLSQLPDEFSFKLPNFSKHFDQATKHNKYHSHTIRLLLKCWWNWNLGSISTTHLRVAVTREDHKSTKRQSNHQYLVALLGSVHVKAARKLRWWNRLLRSTSTFYEQNPNAQKRLSSQQCLLVLLGPTSVKACLKCWWNWLLVSISSSFYVFRTKIRSKPSLTHCTTGTVKILSYESSWILNLNGDILCN